MPLSRRSPGRGVKKPSPSRNVLRRALLKVIAAERVGPYTLLRLRRGPLVPGNPGQFFMLSPPGRVLPRPMSLSIARTHELGFLIDPIGPGTRALANASRGDRIAVLGPLGNGYCLNVERPLLVGGGIGIAPFPYLSKSLGRPREGYLAAGRVSMGRRAGRGMYDREGNRDKRGG